MSLEERKVEASRRRWSRIPNPGAMFKPLKMTIHNIEKVEAEDSIGLKLREEFGSVEEFVRNASAKHLYHDVNHDYFSVVKPRHTPIHLLPPHAAIRPPAVNGPHKNLPLDGMPNSRRSLLNDSHSTRRPPPSNHHRHSAGARSQALNSEVKAKPQESRRTQPEVVNEVWRNSFSCSSQAEVDQKISKLSEEICLPGLMSPEPQKAIPPLPPPKVMTKLQQIELSDNPLDFSVSEDELNPDGDEFEHLDAQSAGFVDCAKESDAAFDGKECSAKLSPTIATSDQEHHFSPKEKPRLDRVSLEDGEISENDFRKGHLRTSSKVRHQDTQQAPTDDVSRTEGENGFLEGTFQRPKMYGNEYGSSYLKHEVKDEVDDLEEGEIDDHLDKQSTSSSSSSSSSSSGSLSSHSLSDDSSDGSEFSAMHSKHLADNDSNIELSAKRDNINKSTDEAIKEGTSILEMPQEHLDAQDTSLSQREPQTFIGTSKSSAFEVHSKKSIFANSKATLDPVKQKVKTENLAPMSKARLDEYQESPIRAPTPAFGDKREHLSNVVTQKPKQEKPLKASKTEAKSFKKIKSEGGGPKSIDEIKGKVENKQSEVLAKTVENKFKDEKKDQKSDAKVNKKQIEQKFTEIVNNQQGISFVSAIQTNNNRKKITTAKEGAQKDKKIAKVDIKCSKRKSDEVEKDTLDKHPVVPTKKHKIEPNLKAIDSQLILRFNTNLFTKLEKADKKRKNEDEMLPLTKKLKAEPDVNLKELPNDNFKKKMIKKQTSSEKPSDQDMGLSTIKQARKSKCNTEITESPANVIDSDKKQRLPDSKKDFELHASQNRKASKNSNKMGIKKEGIKTENKLTPEEIFKRTNDLLSKGVCKDKDKPASKKTSETEQNVGGNSQPHLLVPSKEGAMSSKSNSPREKKDGVKNSRKHGALSSKAEQQVFRGMFRVTSDQNHDSCLTDDMKEKHARSSDAPSKNQSQVELIRRVAEHHLNKSQLALKMAEVIQAENGGRTNFRSLLSSIEFHVHEFLGNAELSKFKEGSFNIRQHDQLITGLELSIKDLERNEERNVLTFLLQSFRVVANRHHYFQMFNKDKDINEAALKQIRMLDPKNSPRSSPDSTCTNPCTIVHQIPNQQLAGTMDASVVKTLNQPNTNYLNMWSTVHIFMTSMEILSKLASDPSCQDLFDQKSLPGDLVLVHKDLQTWTKWFEDIVTRIGSLHYLG